MALPKGGFEVLESLPGLARSGSEWPLAVIGITHSQTCLVLRGRIRALRSAGFRVALISSPGVLLDQLAAAERVEKYPIPIERGIAPIADVRSLFRLWSVLRWLRPQVTEFSTPKAGLLGNIAAALCHVPSRVYMLRGLRLESSSPGRRYLLKAAEKLASWCAHIVLCNSESLRHEAEELGIASDKKLRVIANGSSNGVDLSRFSPGPDRMRARVGIPPGAPVIGFVGRLTRDKGIPMLLDAFDELLKIVPNAWLLLVGWFDQSEDALDLGERARIHCHPRILLTGFVANTAPWYRAMDVLVLPTLREGFPNVILEAAACGIPAVTTIVTGARDAVLPEKTGILVRAEDPLALAVGILRLILDSDLRRRLGRAARSWVEDWFDERRVLGLTQALYEEMRAKAGSRRSTGSSREESLRAD